MIFSLTTSTWIQTALSLVALAGVVVGIFASAGELA